ncbi:hypothetical protein ACKZDW_04460 (plasmid) [Ralstonia syzygii subsp. celebesensis]|uniref:hypothetical protein n=1 Tax=Ralstonia syzygii TaxID=28097 RepID=UPI00191D952D|nr:hypothetical protein [Ralstonia syzygii]QQV57198.1 hypothetical protein JK151_16745 [Ralstonia syzygii subsp. celebesensis]
MSSKSRRDVIFVLLQIPDRYISFGSSIMAAAAVSAAPLASGELRASCMKRLSIWALPARPLLKLRRGHGYEVFSDKIELFCRAGDCDDLPIACRGQNTSSSGWRFICAVSGHTSELGEAVRRRPMPTTGKKACGKEQRLSR